MRYHLGAADLDAEDQEWVEVVSDLRRGIQDDDRVVPLLWTGIGDFLLANELVACTPAVMDVFAKRARTNHADIAEVCPAIIR